MEKYLWEALRLLTAMAATVGSTYLLALNYGCGTQNKPGSIYQLSYTGLFFATLRTIGPIFNSEPLFLVRARIWLRNPNRFHTAAWFVTMVTSVCCTWYNDAGNNVDIILLVWLASLAAETFFKLVGLVSEFQYGWVQYLSWVGAWVGGLVLRGSKFPMNYYSFIVGPLMLVFSVIYQVFLHRHHHNQ